MRRKVAPNVNLAKLQLKNKEEYEIPGDISDEFWFFSAAEYAFLPFHAVAS